jgi:hypothetical protein
MPLVRRRRPVLRAAAVGGAAYMGKRAAENKGRSEEQRFSQQPQQPAPTGALTPEATTQLKELGSLHESGVLTDAEFEAQKRALLGT